MTVFNQQSFRLDGKVALITGGANGLGQNYSKALSMYGANIFVVSNSKRGWEETRQAVEANGQKIGFLQCDITKPDCADSIIEQCVKEMGGLDILVNNAGI